MSKKQLSELDAKRKTLNLRLKSTDVVIKKREKEAIERQRASIVALAREIDCLRVSIQEVKFTAGDSEENVELWSEEIESHLSKADGNTAKLSTSQRDGNRGTRPGAKSKPRESNGDGEAVATTKDGGCYQAKGAD